MTLEVAVFVAYSEAIRLKPDNFTALSDAHVLKSIERLVRARVLLKPRGNAIGFFSGHEIRCLVTDHFLRGVTQGEHNAWGNEGHSAICVGLPEICTGRFGKFPEAFFARLQCFFNPFSFGQVGEH